MKYRVMALLAACLVLHLSFNANAAAGKIKQGVSSELKKEAQEAIRKGLEWLAEKQDTDGGWSDDTFPALTALPLWAFSRSDYPDKSNIVSKAVDHIISYQVDSGLYEGAIYHVVVGQKGGGLPNYNTAICMSALASVGGEKVVPVILKARKFLARSQYVGKKDKLFRGGMGYDPPAKRPYADLSNSYLAYEAMHKTAHYEEYRRDDKVTLNWDAAIEFLEKVHNDPDVNDLSWAADIPSEEGGFAYRPDTYRENSGAYETNGVLKFRSMPGMTYAGMLSYIYAGVDRDDPRVLATVRWIERNWQLERGNRNPAMKGKPEAKEGLYYMYNVMSKGLNALGTDVLTLDSGKKINWRNEMIRKLTDLQHKDGSWLNKNSRYWEGNPVLVTAYTVLALQNTVKDY